MRRAFVGVIIASLMIIGLSTIAPTQKDRPTEVRDTMEILSLVGDIEARTQVFVLPKVPGEVQELNVEVGASVSKGDILAVVEHEELELGVRQAKAALEAAKAGLRQTEALSKINIISQVEQAQAGLSAAKVTLDQAKALSFTQTIAQVTQAEAGLAAIKANMKKAKEGARKQEKKQVEASVEQARAGLENARSNHERMKELFERGSTSQQTFEASETQLDVAEAQYEAARQQLDLLDEGSRKEDIEALEAQVRQAEAALEIAKKLEETRNWEKDIALVEAKLEQAEALFKLAKASEESRTWEDEIIRASMTVEQAKIALELAQKQLSDATITAPISGIISMRNIELGGMASPQSPIFQIVDMDIVKAKVSITESNLYKIRLGDKAVVSVDALREPVEGKVTLISPTIDIMSRTTTVEITIDNSGHRLRPGMFARAETIPE
ncbi:efflux RND transporter periplasmic adaptor subunit [Candidatus Poribacteria bacterium]